MPTDRLSDTALVLMHRARPDVAIAFLAVAAALAAASAALVGGCVPDDGGLPLDQPLFPTGLAVAADRLLVVSSDFDLANNQGALLAAELAVVRAAVAPAGAAEVVPGVDAYKAAAVLPPLGDRPVLTSGGERVYVPTRSTNRVVVLDIGADGALSCGDVVEKNGAPLCGESKNALQLTANDPFDTVILQETSEGGALVRVDAMQTLLSSPEALFFSDDTRRAGSLRVQLDDTKNLGAAIGGVRSAVLRPAVAGSDAVVIAAADLSREASLIGARLLLFAPLATSDIRSFDVTLATGSLSMRDILLVPGQNGENDALIAVLRDPDALARFEIEEAGAVPDVRMSALTPTCRAPQSLALATLPSLAGTVDRVLVTCREGDVVQAVDPLTLRTTDAVRFLGRGPYDVAVNGAVDPVEVYVSFFLDNSIGVLRFLADEGGEAHLVADGRIGKAVPRPEDGRE